METVESLREREKELMKQLNSGKKMTKEEIKKKFKEVAEMKINNWFPSDAYQDKVAKAISYTLLEANIDKYDRLLDSFTDKDGNILIFNILDILISEFEDIEIDITKYNMPFLPDKVLLITKNDLIMLKQTIMGC